MIVDIIIKVKRGNFLFIEPKTKAQTIVERMKNEKKILIKAYENCWRIWGLFACFYRREEIYAAVYGRLLELDK